MMRESLGTSCPEDGIPSLPPLFSVRGSWDSLQGGPHEKSAVLVPFFPSEGRIRVLFLRRSRRLTRHGGEICFPGGMRETADVSPLDTALRETREETGIPPEAVTPVMALPPDFTVVTGLAVYPILGVVRGIDPGRDVTISPEEVDGVCLADICSFPEFPRRKNIRSSGKPLSYPEYDLEDGSVIWGVTARILETALAVVRGGTFRWPS